MSEEKNERLEVTFRLPSDGISQLAELLTTLIAAVKPNQEAAAETVENATFDLERFQHMTKEEPIAFSPSVTDITEPESMKMADFSGVDLLEGEVRREREIGDIASPIRYSYDLASPVAALPEMQVAESREAETSFGNFPQVSDYSHCWERDARRYDSGFPIY